MTVEACENLVEAAINQLTNQINNAELGDFNEATIQHHFAMALHLEALERRERFSIFLERRITRRNGEPFPKNNRRTANIDVFFSYGDDATRCAVELKVYRRANQREPNNRYDAFADLANLEIYLEEHSEVGFLLLFTDHPHYYDNDFGPHTDRTSDFSLREGREYVAGTELSYRTVEPYGPNLTLSGNYTFKWANDARTWRRLLLRVSA